MIKFCFILISIPLFNVHCATFENVEVRLSQEKFVPGEGHVYKRTVPDIIATIQSDNNLDQYINRKSLKNVYIEKQHILELPKDSVDTEDVQQLSITSCGLKNIQPGAFNIKNELQYLSLAYNEIAKIKNNVFTDDKIQILVLDNNKISIIEDSAFNNLKKLIGLSLAHNRISVWNTQWFVGTPIQFLMFEGNLLNELPANALVYNENDKVKPVLEFNNNVLRKIQPGAITGVKHIQKLNLRHNKLEVLNSKIFQGIKSVTDLFLNENKLHRIDVELFQNIAVRHLNLNENELTCIPKQWSNADVDIGYINLLGNPVTCDCVNSWRDAERPLIGFDQSLEINC